LLIHGIQFIIQIGQQISDKKNQTKTNKNKMFAIKKIHNEAAFSAAFPENTRVSMGSPRKN